MQERRLHCTPVIEVCDASETFCLALSAKGATGIVQAFQAGVFLGLDINFNLQIKLARGQAFNDQMLVSHLVLA